MRWVARIHQAFDEKRFRLSYQPIVPIGNGSQGAHYEVLIRMIDQDDNLVGPEAFLPAAERYNLISKLDHWVVESTFAWLIRNPRHLADLYMCAINLSGHSLGSSEFLDFLTHQFESTGVPPPKICLEITETMAIANLSRALRFMEQLREMGCRFALDDFGSGLSSFAYLKNLPVDFLKIDGLFVKDILDDPLDLAVVASINEIGHVMGKKTIAEFVEDQRIFDKLRELGVDYAQGFGIGPPQLFTEVG
jgi:EAL domain-containing protein (putative c-di-GMP-specific phosphodiesterase class I)